MSNELLWQRAAEGEPCWRRLPNPHSAVFFFFLPRPNGKIWAGREAWRRRAIRPPRPLKLALRHDALRIIGVTWRLTKAAASRAAPDGGG